MMIRSLMRKNNNKMRAVQLLSSVIVPLRDEFIG